MIMENHPDLKSAKDVFFGRYRNWHPEQFSDSTVSYDIPLTEEMFDAQMELLSTKKKHAEFETFSVGLLTRLVTPNIKPQTGPDGGGDGKVDAETYTVSNAVSDKWYMAEAGAREDEKWAFAISCKREWKPKIESDVKKIVETERRYTRIVFVSNQYIKSSVRVSVEERLSKKYDVRVEIFDRSWLVHSTFQCGCMDLALSDLGFSDEYKRKTENIGPHDKYRIDRLAEIEKSILRDVNGLDTGYVDELHEACLLARGLERPITEVEGKFRRAIRECEAHGTGQQLFNLIYDHAWTSFFWLHDIDLAYHDYLQLKEFVDYDCSVYRVEHILNVATMLINAVNAGVTTSVDAAEIVRYFKSLEKDLVSCSSRQSCLLYLRLRLAIQNYCRNFC